MQATGQVRANGGAASVRPGERHQWQQGSHHVTMRGLAAMLVSCCLLAAAAAAAAQASPAPPASKPTAKAGEQFAFLPPPDKVNLDGIFNNASIDGEGGVRAATSHHPPSHSQHAPARTVQARCGGCTCST